MNDDNTDVLLIGSRHNHRKTFTSSLCINDHSISFSEKARNLGVYVDPTLSFETHINNLCKTLYLQLRRLSQIRPFLTTEAANKLAVSFILSRIDYCNSLLAGLPEKLIQKLQRIQNNAARIVLQRTRRDPSTHLLKTLHWLPVRERIAYKLAIFCHQCLYSDSFPSYLTELLTPYNPPRQLRSSDSLLLSVPRFSKKTLGTRSFSSQGPAIWNSLPLELRLTQSHNSFKKALKTFLFTKSFSL